ERRSRAPPGPPATASPPPSRAAPPSRPRSSAAGWPATRRARRPRGRPCAAWSTSWSARRSPPRRRRTARRRRLPRCRPARPPAAPPRPRARPPRRARPSPAGAGPAPGPASAAPAPSLEPGPDQLVAPLLPLLDGHGVADVVLPHAVDLEVALGDALVAQAQLLDDPPAAVVAGD